ncbi:hypothetical protein J6590_071324 [Homalodisca vitripennis]|nr:hypothetical protein J6590_071324 [Homalodisca vitripennis]
MDITFEFQREQISDPHEDWMITSWAPGESVLGIFDAQKIGNRSLTKVYLNFGRNARSHDKDLACDSTTAEITAHDAIVATVIALIRRNCKYCSLLFPAKPPDSDDFPFRIKPSELG